MENIISPSLFYFSIYERDKILFFYPPTFNEEDRKKHVGLCLGFMDFVKSFDANATCETVHSHKHRLLLYNAENEIQFALNVNLGFSFVSSKNAISGKNIEFQENSVSDSWGKSLLSVIANLICLKFGSISSVVTNESSLSDLVVPILEGMFDIDFKWKKLFETFGMSSSLHGILPYVPYEHSNYVNLLYLSIFQRMQIQFPFVKFAVVLKNNLMAFSNLCVEDSLAMYSLYLFSPSFLRKPGYFISDLFLLNGDITGKRTNFSCLTFVASRDLTILLFGKGTNSESPYTKAVSDQMISLLRTQVVPVDPLAGRVSYQKPVFPFTNDLKSAFVYINSVNKSFRIVNEELFLKQQKQSNHSLICKLMRILDDASLQLYKNRSKTMELFARTSTDEWLAISSLNLMPIMHSYPNERLFYLLTTKDLNVAEIEEELKRFKLNSTSENLNLRPFAGV